MGQELAVRQEIFENQEVQIIELEGEEWFTAKDIGQALGLEEPRIAVMKILKRNRDEFEGLTSVTKMVTQGKKNLTPHRLTVFNAQGAYLLAILARTPKSKALRRWLAQFMAHDLDRLRQRVAALHLQHQQALTTIQRLEQRELAQAAYPVEPGGLHQEALIFDLQHRLQLAQDLIVGLTERLRRRQPKQLPPPPALDFDPKDLVLVPAHYLQKFRHLAGPGNFAEANRLVLAILEAQSAWEMLVRQFDKLGFLSGKAEITLHYDPECLISTRMCLKKEAAPAKD